MSCFRCPVLWKLFKLDSTVEEQLPAVFSPVVNLKHSTWSEEIWSTIFPTNGPWSSWAASTEPHSHLIARLLHFYGQSGNFSWRDYWKATVRCWGFLSFRTETVSITMCRRLAIHSHIANNCKPVRKNIIFLYKVGTKKYN